MIRHVVCVKFAAATTEQRIGEIFSALHRLKQVVPGISSIVAGANVSPEGLARGFTHAFTVDFDGPASRDAYLADADHGKVGAALVGAAEGGVDGILVIDFVL